MENSSIKSVGYAKTAGTAFKAEKMEVQSDGIALTGGNVAVTSCLALF